MAKINDWQKLTKDYTHGLNEVLYQQYFGAQFIAMAGRHLVKQRDDDSNTSMNYDPKGPYLVGEPIDKEFKVALRLTDLSLTVLRDDLYSITEIPLSGFTMKETFIHFYQMLNDVGIKTTNLKDKLHYDLPDHELIRGSVFRDNDPAFIREIMAHRHNAEVALKEIAADHKDADPVRIWPHHFDTGTLIPLDRDHNGELIRSVGLGWAIPDEMVSEPYFYLSVWSREPMDFPDTMSSPDSGAWFMPGWNGAVLRLSDILKHDSSQSQHETVLSFFKSGIRIIRELLNP